MRWLENLFFVFSSKNTRRYILPWKDYLFKLDSFFYHRHWVKTLNNTTDKLERSSWISCLLIIILMVITFIIYYGIFFYLFFYKFLICLIGLSSAFSIFITFLFIYIILVFIYYILALLYRLVAQLSVAISLIFYFSTPLSDRNGRWPIDLLFFISKYILALQTLLSTWIKRVEDISIYFFAFFCITILDFLDWSFLWVRIKEFFRILWSNLETIFEVVISEDPSKLGDFFFDKLVAILIPLFEKYEDFSNSPEGGDILHILRLVFYHSFRYKLWSFKSKLKTLRKVMIKYLESILYYDDPLGLVSKGSDRKTFDANRRAKAESQPTWTAIKKYFFGFFTFLIVNFFVLYYCMAHFTFFFWVFIYLFFYFFSFLFFLLGEFFKLLYFIFDRVTNNGCGSLNNKRGAIFTFIEKLIPQKLKCFKEKLSSINKHYKIDFYISRLVTKVKSILKALIALAVQSSKSSNLHCLDIYELILAGYTPLGLRKSYENFYLCIKWLLDFESHLYYSTHREDPNFNNHFCVGSQLGDSTNAFIAILADLIVNTLYYFIRFFYIFDIIEIYYSKRDFSSLNLYYLNFTPFLFLVNWTFFYAGCILLCINPRTFTYWRGVDWMLNSTPALVIVLAMYGFLLAFFSLYMFNVFRFYYKDFISEYFKSLDQKFYFTKFRIIGKSIFTFFFFFKYFIRFLFIVVNLLSILVVIYFFTSIRLYHDGEPPF